MGSTATPDKIWVIQTVIRIKIWISVKSFKFKLNQTIAVNNKYNNENI